MEVAMRVVYSGAHPKVIVDELDSEQIIERGTPVDVPDDLGARLIEQATWSQVDAKAQAPSPATASIPAPNPQPSAATPSTAASVTSDAASAPADPTPTKGNS